MKRIRRQCHRLGGLLNGERRIAIDERDGRLADQRPRSGGVDSSREPCELRARFVRAIQMEMASSRKVDRFRRWLTLRRDGVDGVIVAACIEMGLGTGRVLRTRNNRGGQDNGQRENGEGIHGASFLHLLRIPRSSPIRLTTRFHGRPDQGQRPPAHLVHGKAIFPLHHVARRGRPKAIDAQHIACIADIPPPSLRHTHLDGQPRGDSRWQHVVLFSARKCIEEVPARHGDTSKGDALRLQAIGCRQHQTDFRSAGDEYQFGPTLRGVGQDIRTASQPVCRCEAMSIERGHGLSRQHEHDRTVARFARHSPCNRGFIGIGGPDDRHIGIARNDARCSTGWWVGPSSPNAMLSCVKMWMTCNFMSAASRMGGRM